MSIIKAIARILALATKRKDEERLCHNSMCNKPIGKDGYISKDRWLFLCKDCKKLMDEGKLPGEAIL